MAKVKKAKKKERHYIGHLSLPLQEGAVDPSSYLADLGRTVELALVARMDGFYYSTEDKEYRIEYQVLDWAE